MDWLFHSCPTNFRNSVFPEKLSEHSSLQHSGPWYYFSLHFHPCLHPRTLRNGAICLPPSIYSVFSLLRVFALTSSSHWNVTQLTCWQAIHLSVSSSKVVTFLEPIGISHFSLPHPALPAPLPLLCKFYRTYFILPYLMVICVFVFLY